MVAANLPHLTGRSRDSLHRMSKVAELGRRAKAASRLLGQASTASKDAVLLTAADLLLERAPEIQAANDVDLPEGTPHEVVHRDDLVVLPS